MKNIYLFILTFLLVTFIGCTSGSVDSGNVIEPNHSITMVDTLNVTFTKATSITVTSVGETSRNIYSRTVGSSNETEAFFFIRLDGLTPEYAQKPTQYIPVLDNGLSRKDSLNSGTFVFDVDKFESNENSFYLHDESGVTIKSMLRSVPSLKRLCQGREYVYNDKDYDVIWYEIKKGPNGSQWATTNTWNIDGKIVRKVNNDISIIIGTTESFVAKVDDFAIRKDGVYFDEFVKPTDNSMKQDNGALIVRDGIKLTVSDLDELDFIGTVEYTYECWLWTDRYVNIIDTNLKTDSISYKPYTVRYQTYSGHQSNETVPYIKVSIHITKNN